VECSEATTRTSIPIISGGRYFVFVTKTAENPVSHKFVDRKGTKTLTASADKLAQSFFTGSQN
jgi:hypothetical protein